RRNRVDVRKAKAGLLEEGADRAAQMSLHDIRKLTAENHAEPTVAQLVSEVTCAFRHEDRAGVLERPAHRAVTPTQDDRPGAIRKDHRGYAVVGRAVVG